MNDSLNEVDKKISALQSKLILADIQNVRMAATVNKGGRIKDKPDVIGQDIYLVKEDKNVIIVDYFDDYFKVCYDENCGFVNSVWITPSPEVEKYIRDKKFIESQIREENLARIAKKKDLEDKKNTDILIKKLGRETYSKLREGYYWLGMTTEMARVAFGVPDKVNESVGEWGIHQQWVYNHIYLYFENGKLTSYQR